jgi:hypothetical protein
MNEIFLKYKRPRIHRIPEQHDDVLPVLEGFETVPVSEISTEKHIGLPPRHILHELIAIAAK